MTELLDEITSRSEHSETADDDGDFDFDKESEKCLEHLNQIKDAYVFDMSECNLEEVNPTAVSEDEESKNRVDKIKEEEFEEPSTLRKFAYFTSVAATTGFYFFMRKHNLL